MRWVLPLFIVLASCAHTSVNEKKAQTQHINYCVQQPCNAFAKQHNYTVLEADVEKNSCHCKLMSPNIPDGFYVNVPYHPNVVEVLENGD